MYLYTVNSDAGGLRIVEQSVQTGRVLLHASFLIIALQDSNGIQWQHYWYPLGSSAMALNGEQSLAPFGVHHAGRNPKKRPDFDPGKEAHSFATFWNR